MPRFLVPDWPDAPANIGALSTTRQGGVSVGPYDDGAGGGGLNLGKHVGDDPAAVAANRAFLQVELPSEPVWLAQIHSAIVADLDAPWEGPADAAVTTRAGVVCAMMTADCLPVLFADCAGTVVGAAHAGWRGLSAGVLEQTVAAMRAKGGQEITAWLGPAIGREQFEVGPDVLEAFVAGARGDEDQVRASFRPYPGREGKYLADMNALARIALARVGVQRVHGGEHCTVTEREMFYSYRRDGISGRMASLVWLR